MMIRNASADDAGTLSAFGRRVHRLTLAPAQNPGDLAAYLDVAYTACRQRAEILDPSMDTLLLERDGALAAFAQIRPGTEACIAGANPIELWRFYVAPEWHGLGVAAELMAAAEAAALARRARTLWLGVWERNVRAQAFYRKHGFIEVGSHTFMIGSDPQHDLIMVKAI